MGREVKAKDRELEVAIEVDSDVTLQGVLHGGKRTRRAVLVCPDTASGGTMDSPLVEALCEGLARAGAAALRFDFRGVGRSTGKPTDGELEPKDVWACWGWLREHTGRTPMLVGCSFGAAMALSTLSSFTPEIQACHVGLPTANPALQSLYTARSFQRGCEDGLRLLFLGGDEDKTSDVEWIRRTIKGPNITVEALPQQGHLFEGAAADRLVDRVKGFVGLPSRSRKKVLEWIRERLEERRAAPAPDNTSWVDHIEQKHNVMPIDFHGLELWFIGARGDVYSYDWDAYQPPLERVSGKAAREAIQRASRHLPQLLDLL